MGNFNFLLTDYIIIFLFFIAVDYVVLSQVLGPKFQLMAKQIGFKTRLNYLGAFATYLVMLIGFFIFVDLEGSPLQAFLFGVVTYGIYELTNYATIEGWRPEFVILDVLWGGLLYTILFWFLKTFY